VDEDQREPRRGARISANVWIGVEGIDSHPTLRQGNLSATGIYFETSQSVGPAGSVQFLHIESEDHRVVVQVLARIIRTSAISDIISGESVGLAMEFLPSSSDGRQGLERLVRHVVELGLRHQTQVDHRFDADIRGVHTSDRTSVQRLSVQRLTLETDWRASVGDPIELQIHSPSGGAQSFPLQGQVTAVNPAEEGFRVDVRITGHSDAARDRGVSGSTRLGTDTGENEVNFFTDLITEPVEDFSLPAPEHLSGLLSRIRLPTILGLMEMERMSGELRFLGEANRELVLYLKTGRPVDLVNLTGVPESPKQLLAELMRWPEGTFNFVVEEVDRQDNFGTTITSLILDLAREEDEATHEVEITEPGTDFF